MSPETIFDNTGMFLEIHGVERYPLYFCSFTLEVFLVPRGKLWRMLGFNYTVHVSHTSTRGDCVIVV